MENRGKFAPNFIKRYKKLIDIWKAQKLVQDWLPPVTSTIPAPPTAMDYESVLIDSTEYRKGLEDTNDIRRHRKEYLAKRRIREYSCISILNLEFDTLPFQFQGMHTPTIEHVDDPVQTSVRVTPEVGNATHVDDFAEVHVAPEAGDATHVDDDTYVHVDDFAEVRVTPEAGDATHVCTEPHVDVAVDEDMQNLVDGCVTFAEDEDEPMTWSDILASFRKSVNYIPRNCTGLS
ncbi:hypothetical protein ACS0TY_011907 [Phlomoides rotata]